MDKKLPPKTFLFKHYLKGKDFRSFLFVALPVFGSIFMIPFIWISIIQHFKAEFWHLFATVLVSPVSWVANLIFFNGWFRKAKNEVKDEINEGMSKWEKALVSGYFGFIIPLMFYFLLKDLICCWVLSTYLISLGTTVFLVVYLFLGYIFPSELIEIG